MSHDSELAALQVCVRVRPLFQREKDEGNRVCVHYDDPTKQVVLTAVDKGTLIQLHGQTARGFSFDRYYPAEGTSDTIYDDTVSKTVENCFKGYNGTVLAYGQTGSGKTHTMAGGIGIHGVKEEGIIPRVIRHCFAISEQLTRRGKPGESTEISATSLEIYNEELVDLSPDKTNGKLKVQERALPQGGTATEVVGLAERQVRSEKELFRFFDECMSQRSVGSTKMNERSSRSHAIFTIAINRTIVELQEDLDENLKAKILTTTATSKLHLVDLAGSERVKRSGVSGQRLKEATHINGGLLALGNVIVALSKNSEENKKGHVPYRDSKLTRLLQDSLGGNSLTTLITCISSSEGDFEETNNTLKYANRACKIKNIPLPNKYIMLEEDLLPVAPAGGGANFGVTQLAILLEEHERLKEKRAKRAREKAEKEERRAEMLEKARIEKAKTPGYQRLRAHEYDRLRKEKAKGRSGFRADESISGESLLGFKSRCPMSPANSENGRRRPASAFVRRLGSSRSRSSRPSTARSTRQKKVDRVTSSNPEPETQPASGGFESWLSSQAGEPEEKTVSAAPEEPEQNVDPQVDQKSEVSVEEAEPSCLEEATLRGNELASISEIPSSPHVGSETPGSTSETVQEPAAPSSDVDQQIDTDAQCEEKASHSPAGTQDLSQTQDSADSIKVGWGVEEDGVSEFTEFASITEDDDDLDASGEYHALDDMFSERPELLARFKINKKDVISIFKSCSREDYQDVMSLLPENTPLPASDRMTYLLSRLEIHENLDIQSAMNDVAAGNSTMKMAIGPAVGCLMATYGTNMISSCIFEFEDPVQLFDVDERIELWGLQIPHNSARPTLEDIQQQTTGTCEVDEDSPQSPQSTQEQVEQETIIWSSVDRLSMSVGLLYALCNHARKNDVRCGFCVPRPQLLRRWAQAGVAIKEIESPMKLLYPSHAHDYDYYRSSTVAYFMVDEVQSSLVDRLSLVPW